MCFRAASVTYFPICRLAPCRPQRTGSCWRRQHTATLVRGCGLSPVTDEHRVGCSSHFATDGTARTQPRRKQGETTEGVVRWEGAQSWNGSMRSDSRRVRFASRGRAKVQRWVHTRATLRLLLLFIIYPLPRVYNNVDGLSEPTDSYVILAVLCITPGRSVPVCAPML